MSPPHSRRIVLVGVGTALFGLAGCLGSDDANDDTGESGGQSSTATDADGHTAGNSDGGASGNTDTGEPTEETPTPDLEAVPTREGSLPLHYSFDHIRDRITSGGPGKDGIPSVDDPSFESPEAASEWLEPGDVVFGVVRGDEAKAYPQRILVWHEIANDVIGGDPVSVTYCPLTGTALGFERGRTTFGVSGDLVNSNLVMYDRETDSRWPQIMATAVEGPLESASLQQFPVTWTTFERWQDVHPETTVLSRETGHIRNYNNDPYGAYNPPRGYYTNTATLFPPLTRDGPTTYNPKRVVYGVREPDGAVIGFLKDAVRKRGVLTGTSVDTAFVAVYDARLDAVRAYRNPESKAVEAAESRNRILVDGERFEPNELPLEPVVGFDAMWFAWTRIYPETVIVNR